tara:strand:+ start:2579 stop:3655 length:1077 start_codon:yes stop_codon:yes gene_type:complete
MGEKIKSKIIDNFPKDILKPLDNDNNNNSCWINSALYLLSSHPYIMFQYLLVDDTRISSVKKDIYNDIYINNIIYNYKYIKSEHLNENSTLLYREILHKNLYDKFLLYDFIDLVDDTYEWGNQYDAQITLNLLYDILTKSHSMLNENVYLTVETKHLSNATDIDKLLYVDSEVEYENKKFSVKKMLLGFVAGRDCHDYNVNAYGEQDLYATHWVSYIRTSLSNDNEWYKFDGLYPKGKKIKKGELYDCYIKNYIKNLMCIYIDIDKFKKILSDTTISKKYDKFIEVIEPTTSNINSKILAVQIENLSNDVKESVGKNKYIDINLLSIQELEYIYKTKIKDDYYNKYIIDKRAYFINLN